MKQVLIIHGGSSFNSYESYLTSLKSQSVSYERLLKSEKWRDWIADTYTNGDVLLPTFPNGSNAQYDEWVIYFEKLLPFLDETTHLIGYSLGAMFLARYLHENTLATPVARIILISPCYDNESTEELGSFKVNSAVGLEKSAQEIHLFHSKDDPISPFTEFAKFQSDLPAAETHIFEDRNHFFQPTFPELLDLINKKLPS